MAEDYRARTSSSLRVLFCFGVSRAFFSAGADERQRVVAGLQSAFADLTGRFGITVFGTMDDDELVVGPSAGWPWTCYILADVPDLDAVRAVTSLVRDSEVGEDRLWKYIQVEARVGRRLFFGNE